MSTNTEPLETGPVFPYFSNLADELQTCVLDKINDGGPLSRYLTWTNLSQASSQWRSRAKDEQLSAASDLRSMFLTPEMVKELYEALEHAVSSADKPTMNRILDALNCVEELVVPDPLKWTEHEAAQAHALMLSRTARRIVFENLNRMTYGSEHFTEKFLVVESQDDRYTGDFFPMVLRYRPNMTRFTEFEPLMETVCTLEDGRPKQTQTLRFARSSPEMD